MPEELKIFTNNHKRELIGFWELTDKEKEDFDMLNEDDLGLDFFRYKGHVYYLDDFLDLTNRYFVSQQTANHFKGWDGWNSEGFGFGTLIKFPVEDTAIGIDTEHIIVGWYSG